MRDELQSYLDGELGLDELPVELRSEAERWERLLADIQALGPESAPAGLEFRVRRSLPALRRRSAARRAAEWVVRPRSIRVSPLAGLAAAAALAFIVLLPRGQTPDPSGTLEAGPSATTTIYVQFMLEAPSAQSVAVAGDFNSWMPELVLADPDGDGVWSGRVALKPGVHQYMFVIDGSQWLTDPGAGRYVDDGFGNRNAVLVIPEPATS
jgi:hypothetical protein